MSGSDGKFKWQGGYGALTIGDRSLETVTEYATKQKEHHRENKLIVVYEKVNEED